MTGVFRRPFFRLPSQVQFGLEVLSSGAASFNVEPGIDTLVLTGNAPTVASSVTASPGIDTLVLTGFAPTVSYTAFFDITIPVGALVLTGYAPSAAVVVPDSFMDPGWGPNGEFLSLGTPQTWAANAPPIPVNPADNKNYAYTIGSETVPNIAQYEDEGWTSMDSYGYISTGERLMPAGAAVWTENQPPIPVDPGGDRYMIYSLGVRTVPWIDQDDDERWKYIYLGGVL